MCTRVLWSDSGQGVLVGRNMDWHADMPTNLWALPRGTRRVGSHGDDNPLTWTSQYGSVVATGWDVATGDGVNEMGLAAHILWLTESDYGQRDPALPALTITMWAQYFLDQFATVADAVASLDKRPMQVRPAIMPGTGETSTVHLALEDTSGDSAIIEYLDGTPHIHHDRSYAVMTNSPPFDQQLEHLCRYQGLGGTEPLPGTTEASDRFVRASYYLARLPKAPTKARAYAALLSVMRNAAQPFGTADPERPEISTTIWRTLTDLTSGIYAFESTFSPDTVWVHTDRLDRTTCQRLDLSQDGLVGDVTDRFVPTPPFTFLDLSQPTTPAAQRSPAR